MSRIVVFGASGFVGSALVRHLRQNNRTVVGISRAASAEADHVVGAYTQAEIAPLLCAGDVIVHLAAKAHDRTRFDDDSSFHANVHTTKELLAAARSANTSRFIFLSSVGVNGPRTLHRPFDESDIPAPQEAYARSKLACEQLVIAATADQTMVHVIVRPPLVYGPDAPGNFGRLARAVAWGRPLPVGAIRNQRSFVALGNLIDFLTCCVDHPSAAQQVFLIADGKDLATSEWVRRMAKAIGRPDPAVAVPVSWLKLASSLVGKRATVDRLSDSLCVDITKARQMLGWTPPFSIDQALTNAMQTWRHS